MAFPIGPTVGQIHTEEGIQYQWTGSTWDLTTGTFQELIESTVDPTAADTSDRGTIWRNTLTGSAWEYSVDVSTGVSEWVEIVADTSVQVSATAPTTQADGSAHQPGDFWIDSSKENTLYAQGQPPISWDPIRIAFDNTTASLTGNPNTTQTAIDVLAARISVLTKGLSFYGTYDALNDAADYTAASGLVDSSLPSAGPTNKDTYLVINADGTPGTGPLAGTVMTSGDWVISDGSAWTHLDLTTTVSTFIGHPDTPTTYAGSAGKIAVVNATETALEFVSPTDTQSILSAAAPTFRDEPTNLIPLQVGDRWVETATLNPYIWDGSTWQPIVPVIVSTTTPTVTTNGLLWYNPTVSTLFVRDESVLAWVGV